MKNGDLKNPVKKKLYYRTCYKEKDEHFINRKGPNTTLIKEPIKENKNEVYSAMDKLVEKYGSMENYYEVRN